MIAKKLIVTIDISSICLIPSICFMFRLLYIIHYVYTIYLYLSYFAGLEQRVGARRPPQARSSRGAIRTPRRAPAPPSGSERSTLYPPPVPSPVHTRIVQSKRENKRSPVQSIPTNNPLIVCLFFLNLRNR